ncbi:hypothetical protein LMG8520_1988 [Lactococcus lactis subsp. lactis]|uniref:Uncharacterized protein n=2 Tax=Lactococcus lactis TaxID=1358 RepID=A0A2A5S6A0_LACLH|nr:hypothetical protein [Lactococcus lactis]KSU07112.1 hypothetical protein LMG8520_1988 [Lactococcus lactis subsp. lactis]PCS09047.1 hypothetical protein RU90_GL002526 [Lactococcus lactis subsp. hordniae]
MSDRIFVQVISIDLTLKNILKPAIILAIIVGLLFILLLGIAFSHGMIPYNDNLIPKK